MNLSDNKIFNNNKSETRNIFVETHFGKPNIFIALLKEFFLAFAIYGSSFIEVFLRKRFGERYMSISHPIITTILIFYFGGYFAKLLRARNGFSFLLIFILIYLGLSIKHRMEISKYGTTYDFKRFSLSHGEIAPFWYKIIGKRIFGVKINEYTVKVVLEPALAFLVGSILLFFSFSRLVGGILIFSAICFAIKNFTQAQLGRNWVLDIIDDKICSELNYDLFIERKPSQETKGIYLPIELPEEEETRRMLYNAFNQSMGIEEDIWVNDELDD
ncbi:hypothetical protein KORDIASMS9_02820 [Kordia sp. SMS9]|uniref:hypothetical protein n=1 Tax=Kordia sp. SMS9 TaxID=2282170 RepID=UPI000E0CC451|nr:hypothetical protein [Kordia sp. SMS9]AXG70580.1 hypothetical protein KORDIASMS9_02820 [Kordia sp. SMS9]